MWFVYLVMYVVSVLLTGFLGMCIGAYVESKKHAE